MSILELKKEITNVENSIEYYKSIVNILKDSYANNLEFYFIKYLIYLKKIKLLKLKKLLHKLENNINPKMY